MERELLKNQILWIGRINALFSGFLGTLSGMSLLHIVTLFGAPNLLEFVKFYARFARIITVAFMILTTMALILGITMSLIYRQKSQEKMRSLDNDRHSHRSQYTIAVVISVVIGVSWMIQFIIPYYIIQVHY